MKNFFNHFFIILMLLVLLSLPFLSSDIKASVNEGTEIVFNELVPSVFPFLFLSSLISSYGNSFLSKLFAPVLCSLLKISKNAVPCVITGLLGGFPSGAISAARLFSENKISKEEAERLPVFCNNAGLMFTVGTVGLGHFSSFKAGIILYFFHIFASLIIGVLSRKKYCYTSYSEISCSQNSPDFSSCFIESMRKSLGAMALISGNFIIFRVITSMLSSFFGESLLVSFISGLFEVTGGILSMPETPIGLILSAFLLSFNGICVHMQSMAFFAPLKLSMKKCVAGKLFSAFLTAFLMFVSLPHDFMAERNFPPMAFHITLILVPLLFLFPYKIKKASDKV